MPSNGITSIWRWVVGAVLTVAIAAAGAAIPRIGSPLYIWELP